MHEEKKKMEEDKNKEEKKKTKQFKLAAIFALPLNCISKPYLVHGGRGSIFFSNPEYFPETVS